MQRDHCTAIINVYVRSHSTRLSIESISRRDYYISSEFSIPLCATLASFSSSRKHTIENRWILQVIFLRRRSRLTSRETKVVVAAAALGSVIRRAARHSESDFRDVRSILQSYSFCVLIIHLYLSRAFALYLYLTCESVCFFLLFL